MYATPPTDGRTILGQLAGIGDSTVTTTTKTTIDDVVKDINTKLDANYSAKKAGSTTNDDMTNLQTTFDGYKDKVALIDKVGLATSSRADINNFLADLANWKVAGTVNVGDVQTLSAAVAKLNGSLKFDNVLKTAEFNQL